MSDKLYPLSLPILLKRSLEGIRNKNFMGIPGSLFHRPGPADPFITSRYGKLLETPLGVAAGPHTQLAQNIVAAWLCGARYIELKTVQTLDELEVSKPCIDMQDEGYNCEWSQELRIPQSFAEYLNAWIVIHILHREMGFPGNPGMIFNMSVGYNLEGILQENVQWFFSKMKDCSAELAEAKSAIEDIYPAIVGIDIPSCISANITLSTMHGCPPDEIGRIATYLMEEKRLHTAVKLNPTLLGPETLRGILNGQLGFRAVVPDSAFEHDLKYPDALRLIRDLTATAEGAGVEFGIKLTNTLECENHKDVFGQENGMMYMSGRALHPISVTLARKLQAEFGGALDISFSAGADCFNISDILACGIRPVTVCTDLLKPGGYGRLRQYIENITSAFAAKGTATIGDFISTTAGTGDSQRSAALANLHRYADRVAENPAYHREEGKDPSIKTDRELDWFDCIHAPCTDTCPTHQDIPEYLRRAAQGNFTGSFETIFDTNPFPSVTGMVCDHLCQFRCTRINYDAALQIREVKRFVAENSGKSGQTSASVHSGKRAAIIGAGPAGLSCAWFLRKAGYEVDLFEEKPAPGGMVSAAIPAFRLSDEAIGIDIGRILAAGVKFHAGCRVDRQRFEEMLATYDALFLAAGAQKSLALDIPGIDARGVLDPLRFLFAVREGNRSGTGKNVVVIGGGNTAMDAARTARRLVGPEGTVTVVYRRTRSEMPADTGEIVAATAEGIRILELANPLLVVVRDGSVAGLQCSKNVLAGRDRDGRPAPVAVPGSEFTVDCDTIIPAIGQRLDLDFIDTGKLAVSPGSYRTRIPNLFIGGDALRGASTAINAVADGRKAALEMSGGPVADIPEPKRKLSPRDLDASLYRKAQREFPHHPAGYGSVAALGFDLTERSLTREETIDEASRCLSCDTVCNVCVSVCPNLANFGYMIETGLYPLTKAVRRDDGTIGFEPDREFRVDQPYQVLNIRDLCNECGNCTTFCPTQGRPFADKPGLCLDVPVLMAEGEGFYYRKDGAKEILLWREQGHIRTLEYENSRYKYETDQVRAILDKRLSLLECDFLTPCVREFSFGFAAEMSIVMQGARQFFASSLEEES